MKYTFGDLHSYGIEFIKVSQLLQKAEPLLSSYFDSDLSCLHTQLLHRKVEFYLTYYLLLLSDEDRMTVKTDEIQIIRGLLAPCIQQLLDSLSLY